MSKSQNKTITLVWILTLFSLVITGTTALANEKPLSEAAIQTTTTLSKAAATVATKAEKQAPTCYEVKLGERTVLCITHGVGSIKPEERGSSVEKRLKKIADDYSFDPKDLQVEETHGFFHIVAQEDSIVSVGPMDKDLQSQIGGAAYAHAIVDNMRIAIPAYRESRNSQHIIKGLIYASIATVVFYIIWLIGKNLFHALQAHTPRISSTYLKHLRIKSYQLVNPRRATAIALTLISAAKTISTLFLIYFYISIVLSFFPWTAELAPKILNYVLDPLINVVTVIVNYIPNIFYIVIICLFTHYLLRAIKVIFNEIEAGNINFSGFHAEWAHPTFKIVRVMIYALALVMVFPYLPGSSSPAFQGLSVFLGVIISFSSGSAIANVIAGIVITYMRPFKVGDRVKIADTVGDIMEKTFLVTRIKTIKNTDITIPNTQVLGSHIVNYSSSAKEPGLILNPTITMGYDIPWNKVHELLKAAADRTERLEKNKPPFILQTALNDTTVSYELNVYTQHANEMIQIYSQLYKHIIEEFQKAGINMLVPNHHVLHKDETLNTNQQRT